MLREDSRHLQRHSRRFAVRAAVAEWLTQRTWSRLTMAAVVALCTAVGISTSIGLRQIGLTSMGLRFPAAFAVSYSLFLFLLGLMVFRATNRIYAHQERLFRESQRHQCFSTSTGRRDLGEVSTDCFAPLRNAQNGNQDPRAIAGILLFMLAATIVLICVYFVCVAPTFLAELIVEGACLAGLYRPRDRLAPFQWYPVALEQTVLPALAMAACFMVVGLSLQLSVPRAETVVDVWEHAAACREVAARPNVPVR
jgi:hypothetical protein